MKTITDLITDEKNYSIFFKNKKEVKKFVKKIESYEHKFTETLMNLNEIKSMPSYVVEPVYVFIKKYENNQLYENGPVIYFEWSIPQSHFSPEIFFGTLPFKKMTWDQISRKEKMENL